MDQEDSEPIAEFPLIPASESVSGFTGVEKVESFDSSSNTIGELKKQVQLAGPLVIVGFLNYSLQMISVIFLGHLGELSLSSATMATSFAGVTSYYFILGMASALETFFGQAYGAKQYHMLGIHLQRAMLVFMVTCIPIAFIWSFTGHIFALCGQDMEISAQAGIYARWLIPSIFPYGLFQCQIRFLQAQSNVKPLIISTVVTTLLHVLVSWTMVFGIGLGSKGTALSAAISYLINVLILALYIRLSPNCLDWTLQGGYERSCRFSVIGYSFSFYDLGFLPSPKLETSMMAISFDTSALVFRIPCGIGSAVSTRVSNELGAGQPHVARLAVSIAIFLAAAQGLLLCLTMVSLCNIWGYLYTNEVEVVKYIASVMPVLVISNFMDGIQAVLPGTARGCGWQKIGAFVNLGAYYLIGLPSAIILTFVLHFGAKGLWMGIISGSASQALVLLVLTIYTDWEHQARKLGLGMEFMHLAFPQYGVANKFIQCYFLK